jgi:SecD/SecF fusion protein
MKRTLLLMMLAIAAGLWATGCSGSGETLRYTVQLSEEGMLKSLAGNNAEDPNFVNVLEKSLALKQQFPDSMLVDIFCRAWERELPDIPLARIFSNYRTRDYIASGASNVEVFRFFQSWRDEAYRQAILLITSRLDWYGYRLVDRPIYSGQARGYYEFDTTRLDRVHFYLQEAKDTAVVKQLIETCGKMEIYETCRLDEFNTSPLEGIIDSLHMQGHLLEWEKPVLCHVKQEDCRHALTVLNRLKTEGKISKNLMFAPGRPEPENDGLIPVYLLKITTRSGEAVLDGSTIIDAKVVMRKVDGVKLPALVVFLNAEGARTFSRLTRENVDRRLAIVIDGVVHSAPVVNAEIVGGQFAIDGNSTEEELNILASILKSGMLPVPCKVINVDKIE